MSDKTEMEVDKSELVHCKNPDEEQVATGGAGDVLVEREAVQVEVSSATEQEGSAPIEVDEGGDAGLQNEEDVKIPAPTNHQLWHVLAAGKADSRLLTAFRSPEEVKVFLTAMESDPGNPFPGRNIHIRPDPMSIDSQIVFWKSVYRVLERFGEHVHVCRVDFRSLWGIEPDELKHEQILQRCLSHLPHLRSLAVTINDLAPPKDENLTYLKDHPLALLPQLETLMVSCISDDLTASILASCCVPHKIRRLFLGEFRDTNRGIYDEVLSFTNLEVFHDGSSVAELERFSAQVPVPPLRELWLHSQGLNEFTPLFNQLEMFGATLTKLALNGFVMRLKWTAGIGYDYRVNLPRLESLRLYEYDGPFEPFLGLSSLTELVYSLTVGEPQGWDGSAVELRGIEDKMENSNLWKLMPSLHSFVIQGHGERGKYAYIYRRNSETGVVVRTY